MKTANRWISLALVFALLLTGCGKKAAEPTTGAPASESAQTEAAQTTAAPVPETEPAQEPGPADVYTAAAAAIGDYSLDYTYEIKKSFAGEDFSFIYQGLQRVSAPGEDTMTADDAGHYTYTSEQLTFDSDYDKSYLDGKAYYHDDEFETDFSAGHTAEEYLGTVVPAALFDPENYNQVSWKDDKQDTVVFEDAELPEIWLGYDIDIITDGDAGGTVTFDADGSIKSQELTAWFKIGGVRIDVKCTAELKALEQPLTAADVFCPAETKELGDIRIVDLLSVAEMGLFVNKLSVTHVTVNTSHAAGQVQLNQTSFSFDRTEPDDIVIHDNDYITLYTSDGTESRDSEIDYKDGKLTYTVDDEEQDVDGDPSAIADNLVSYIVDYYPMPYYMESAELEDAGDCWIIRYEYDGDGQEYVREQTEYALFSEYDFLSQYSTKYTPDHADGYISIDKVTGMPVVCRHDYSGDHVIQGSTYELSQQSEADFTIADADAYYTAAERYSGREEEPEEKPTPLLYEVTSPEGGHMWLFGSIHIGDERSAYLPDYVMNAFDSSDALAVEVNIKDQSENLDKDPELKDQYYDLMMYSDGTTYEDHLSEDVLEDTRKALEKYGWSILFELIPYKVQVVDDQFSFVYQDLGHGLSHDRGVDMRLLTRAGETGKEIIEVEDLLEHYNTTYGLPDETQELSIKGTLGTSRFDYYASIEELFDLWCSGDEAELTEYINDEDESEEMTPEEKVLYDEYNERMMTVRNKIMFDKAVEYLSGDKVVFFTVGLAHLLAEGDGLVESLRNAGYAVNLVGGAAEKE